MKRAALTFVLSALCTLGLLAAASAQTTPTITTFSDGRYPTPATKVGLSNPRDVAADSAGNYYILSQGTHSVYKVDSSGTLTPFAGNGICGFSGDGGPAVEASFCNPSAVAVDPSGNVAIADAFNRIRKVDSTGTVTTIAGGASCCAVNDGGPATSAWLNQPQAIVFDAAGNLYIADYGNYRIRKVDTSGNISTFAGNGLCCQTDFGTGAATSHYINGVAALAIDGSGNLYANSSFDQGTRIIDPSGNITAVFYAGTNYGLAIDASGNLFASLPNGCCASINGTSYGDQVLEFDPTHSSVAVVAGVDGSPGYNGDGTATTHDLQPFGLAMYGSDLLVADQGNNRIREVDTSGNMTTVAGTGAYGGYAIDPYATAVDSSGNVYFADGQNSKVSKISADGQTLTDIAGTGVYGVSPDGPAATSALASPVGVAVDGAGNVYISEQGSQRVRKVDTSGNMTTIAGTGTCAFSGDGPATSSALCDPAGLALDSSGNLYVADLNNNRIRKIDTAGNMTTVAGMGNRGFAGDGGPATAAALNSPNDVAIDSAGNLYIADLANNRIRMVDTNGIINTVAGNGACFLSNDGPALNAALCSPRGVAATSSGTIVIADTYNNRILALYPTGQVRTIAGDGANGFAGDGGSAYTANLSQPFETAVDSSGNLFIADTQNLRIREVVGAPLTPPATDLSVGLSASPAKAAPGTNITYSITVSNIGGNSAGGVTVTDNLDASLTFVSCSTTGTGACGGSGNNRNVTFSNLGVGESDIITLVASVNSGATGTINDTATVASISPDSNSSNNSASASVSLGTPTVTLSTASLTFPNQKVNTTSAGRTFTIRNTGNAGLVITGFTLGGANPGEFSYTSGTLPITVAPGTSTTISVKFTPTANGAASATLSIADNISGTPPSVNLSGDGVAVSATKVTASPNPAQVGQTVTFTAVVTSAAAGTPTGTMTFKDGTATLGSVALDATGAASLSTSTLAAGLHTISAAYSGDSSFAASSGAVKENVGNSTTASVASSMNPSTYGTSVTFTATVSSSAGAPVGTVVFKNGSATLGSATLSGGQATLTTSALTGGSHSITVAYSPPSGSGLLGSTSPVLTQTVSRAATTTTVTTSGSPSTAGSPVTFTATVTSSVGTPAGNVVFKNGTTTLGTVALSGGTASLTTSSLPTGTLTIKAVYNGNINFTGSSASIAQTVQ